MEKVLQLIKDRKLFKPGSTIGVGVSGGSDSMSLLHLLDSNKDDLDIDVVAINIDHCLREESALDTAFVSRWCRENHIRLYKFKVDVNTLAKTKKMSIEAAAREARYGVFDTLIKKNMVDMIATAHHMSDQAETVLLHILRGSGLQGARGMTLVRDGVYVKPFLYTEKYEINSYIYTNKIETVEDESNNDDRFQRNFIRNRVMPLIRTEWKNADKTLSTFASLCANDDDYINDFALTDGIISDEKYVKIPLSYFTFNESVTSRIILKAIKMAGLEDIERKHIIDIVMLYEKENGTKIDLPKGARAIKEYEYITLTKQEQKQIENTFKIKVGKTEIPNFGTIYVKRTNNYEFKPNVHLIDINKLPKNCVWRKRQDGDVITKFGGGTKKLKSYLIDKKVPARLRDIIPVLASESEVYVVGCVDISDKARVDDDTKQAYAIEYFIEH